MRDPEDLDYEIREFFRAAYLQILHDGDAHDRNREYKAWIGALLAVARFELFLKIHPEPKPRVPAPGKLIPGTPIARRS